MVNAGFTDGTAVQPRRQGTWESLQLLPVEPEAI